MAALVDTNVLVYRVDARDERKQRIATVRAALRATAAWQLAWFDALIWAYAETNGVTEIVSEDFEHGRHYGSVRVLDPFR